MHVIEINLSINMPNKGKEAIRTIKTISTFIFIFICVFFLKILFRLGLVSKLLQSTNVDLLKAVDKL